MESVVSFAVAPMSITTSSESLRDLPYLEASSTVRGRIRALVRVLVRPLDLCFFFLLLYFQSYLISSDSGSLSQPILIAISMLCVASLSHFPLTLSGATVAQLFFDPFLYFCFVSGSSCVLYICSL